jgi:hypothetical protein
MVISLSVLAEPGMVGGTFAPTGFGISVKPIPTRAGGRVDNANHISLNKKSRQKLKYFRAQFFNLL